MKKGFAVLFFCFLSASLFSQNILPLKEWNYASVRPVIFYISGDGGFNSFSTSLCTLLNQSGYAVTALNSKSWFWDKKTPELTTINIAAYLKTKLAENSNRQIVFIGYSFGADVMPFIVNRLPNEIKQKVSSVIMLSPSSSTDFEIHFSDMLGSNKKRSMDVLSEINRMGSQKTTILFGENDISFSAEQVILKNFSRLILPGGHSFEGNTEELVKKIIKLI